MPLLLLLKERLTCFCAFFEAPEPHQIFIPSLISLIQPAQIYFFLLAVFTLANVSKCLAQILPGQHFFFAVWQLHFFLNMEIFPFPFPPGMLSLAIDLHGHPPRVGLSSDLLCSNLGSFRDIKYLDQCPNQRKHPNRP